MTGPEINKLRQSLNLSQAQFAQLFGLHPITVMRWEKGTAMPTDYQQVLLERFKKTAEEKEVRDTVGKILIGAGIIAALLLLLNSSSKGK
jgi:transcriptional regulator with XRE-family HTH domain